MIRYGVLCNGNQRRDQKVSRLFFLKYSVVILNAVSILEDESIPPRCRWIYGDWRNPSFDLFAHLSNCYRTDLLYCMFMLSKRKQHNKSDLLSSVSYMSTFTAHANVRRGIILC
jgi:hypothetical protein